MARLLAILLSAAVTSSGCIGYEEELWLNSDGSGRMSFEVSVSEAIMAFADSMGGGTAPVFSGEELQTNLAKIKGVTVEETKTFSKSGNRVFAAKLRFSSIDFIKDAASAGGPSTSGTPNLFGEVQIQEDDAGNLLLSRTIGPFQPPGMPGRGDDAFIKGMEQAAKAMLANYIWKYKVHFPARVIRANTADSYIDKDTNTVTWEFSLASLMSEPGTMKATVSNPVPPWLRFVTRMGPAAYVAIILVAGLLAMGAVVALAVVLRRRSPNVY